MEVIFGIMYKICIHMHKDTLLVENLYIKIGDLSKKHVPFQPQVVELDAGLTWFCFVICSVLDHRQCFYTCL